MMKLDAEAVLKLRERDQCGIGEARKRVAFVQAKTRLEELRRVSEGRERTVLVHLIDIVDFILTEEL